jgi:PAS domain S-box-containing protein
MVPDCEIGRLDDQDARRTSGAPALPFGEVDFRSMTDSIPVPVILVRRSDEVILYANRALQETLGLTPEKVTNRNWGMVVSRLRDRRRLQELLATNGAVNGEEVTLSRKDGQVLSFSIWQRRVVCAGNECVLTVLADASSHKAAYAELAEKTETLQSLLEVAEHDRELIGFEIHDGVIQDITGAIMHLEAMRLGMQQGKSESIVQQMETVSRLLRDGVKEARRLIDGVTAPDFETTGFFGALQRLITKFSETASLRVDLKYDVVSARLDRPIEAAVYRIVQEALHNVWRHSKSTEARVLVRQHPKQLEVVIQDWGLGFDPAKVGGPQKGKHFGLTGIRQRAHLLHGSCEIESLPGRGTTVRVVLPLS